MSTLNAVPVLTGGLSGHADITKYEAGHLFNDLAFRADGKIVAIGTGYLYRFEADGTADTSFGNAGKLATFLGPLGSMGYIDLANITSLENGKLLITGNVSADTTRYVDTSLVVMRLNADGSPDPTFNNGAGKVVNNPAGNTYESVVGTAILDDGRILVAASSSDTRGNETSVDDPQHIAFARYLPNGTPDASFGTNGIVIGGNSHARPTSMVVQADGKILVVATDVNSGSGYYKFMLFRFNSDGTPDKSFGVDGALVTDFASPTYVKSAYGMKIAVQADGKIVAIGAAPPQNNDPRLQEGFAVVRYNQDGTLDKTFSGDGKFSEFIAPNNGTWRPQGDGIWGESRAHDLHLNDDGSIVVAGTTAWGRVGNVDMDRQLAIIRLRADGSFDTTFGTNGYATTGPVPGVAIRWEEFANLIVGPDGRMVIGGGMDVTGSGWTPFMTGFNPDGSLDATFGTAGAGAQNSVVHLAGHPDQFLNASILVDDSDVDDLNNGNYESSHVTLVRAGGANAQDNFVAGGLLRFENGRALLDGVDIGSVVAGSGTLRIDFNQNATQAKVNQVLQSIAYDNSDSAQAPRQLTVDWTFSDGHASGNFSTALTIQPVEVPYWIDALLDRRSEGQTAEQLRVLLRSFIGAEKNMAVTFDASGSGMFSAAQRQMIERILDEVEWATGINFGATGTTLSIKNSTELDPGEGAATPLTRLGAGAYVSLLEDSAILENSSIVLHALGHALGLKDGDKPSANGSVLPSADISNPATAMLAGDGGQAGASVNYGDLDIAALQFLYGPNTSVRAGNDIYRLNADSSNFIWDGAGSDTVSGADITANITLHLEPGYWDYIGSQDRVITAAGQITVNYGSAIENAIGGSGNDSISGTGTANSLTGGAGNDRLAGLGGNDQLDGGVGIDTAVFSGARSNYTVKQYGTGFTVAARTGGDGTDTLLSAERIEFRDGMLAIDLDGSAGQAYRLYKAVFGREPDTAGLGYWIAAMDKGMTSDSVAKLFMTSPEFATQYGNQPDSTKLITTLYKNVLHREPDAGGFAWWLGMLDEGKIAASDALLGFSESVENRAQVIGEIQNGIAFTPFYG